MDTNALKKFAQAARNLLIDQVTSKLDLIVGEGSAARRQHPQAMKDLDAAIGRDGKRQVIEQVAYTWFNRFTALRFMDANGYTAVGVVSPAEGQTRPELLSEAVAGNLPEGAPGSISALLDNRTPSSDPQAEAYRELLVHACNTWHGPMPFLFEQIDDYTELLMPEDLLSQTSILAELRKVMTEDACQDVEIIGWLYQFYISEKKDQVFAGLKKNQKITAENIPAATQLFTPHWIVRYLVENSLGRLWLLNRPNSKLAEQMDYYIAPEEPETDFLRITRPEDIRICDPAAGSGHMLTYAFDLLYAIYEEEGYDTTEIPALILTHNLTGVEIDDRAGALAAFALAMKAAAKLGRRRFLRMAAKPDICVLQPSGVTLDEVWQLWSQLPGSFDDTLADLRRNLRGLPGFTEEIVLALDQIRRGLDQASSADAIMALSTQFKGALDRSVAFFDELASNPKVASAYEGIAPKLWGAVVNQHPWDDVERALKDFRKGMGATNTSRRLEDIMVTLMKPAGPSEDETNALSEFQSRAKYAAGQTEQLSFFREKVEALCDNMQSCLHLLSDIRQFEQAKNFGSLIVPKLRDPAETLRVVEARDFGGDLLLKEVQERVLAVLRMAEALSPKYHVVVANPPYMGSGGMNGFLKSWTETNYPESKSDLFAAFIERATHLVAPRGFNALVTMEVWMFLSSFQRLRAKLFSDMAINSLVHMPYLGKGGTSMGISFGTVAYVASKWRSARAPSNYCCVRYFETDSNHVPFSFPPQNERLRLNSHVDFSKIPGQPVAYWLSDAILNLFDGPLVSSVCEAGFGIKTGNNEIFMRLWHEIADKEISFNETGKDFSLRWYPCASGGQFRKWYGNQELVVDYQGQGRNIERYAAENGNSFGFNGKKNYFRKSITWPKLTSAKNSFRSTPEGHNFDGVGLSAFFDRDDDYFHTLQLLNSPVVSTILPAIAPTMSLTSGDFLKIPLAREAKTDFRDTERLIGIGKTDWDAYETSWEFTTLPLLQPDHRAESLEGTYTTLRAHWQSMTDEMQRLEKENNRIFIDAYGLQDELTPEVPINEITLTCNPAYRYGVKGAEADRETRLRADTVAEFLHYAVGCMFGRYSLDAPGLILANQGERLADYLARIPEPSFMPDEDNVIPVLDADWFPDDITERFRLFLRETFGEAHFRENLRFIEDALGKDIRKYFTKDFYTDHVKRYKKRPIYWMFASPKGSFQALVYMHRYRSDTVSVVLNDYLREYINKLEGERGRLEKLSDDPSASQVQRTKALKDMAGVGKQIEELNLWERDVVFPMAQQKIEIDLDEGVKANYPKFEGALKKIAGLEAKDD